MAYHDLFRGSNRLESMLPIGLFGLCRDQPDLPVGDFTKLADTSCFLVSWDVMQALAPVAGDAVAFYPTEVEGLERYLMHTPARADAVDEDRSTLTKFSGGKIMIAKNLVLNRSVVERHTFFQLAHGPAGLFAYGEAARVMLDHEFTGIELAQVDLS